MLNDFYAKLRQHAGDEWQNYVNHAFIRQLGDASLPAPAFRRYLTQDYLFLIHFARAYALLASKFHTLPEVLAATRSLNAIVDELPLHVRYCAEWGLSEVEMASEVEASETLNYTRYVLDIGHSGDALDLLTALMPCVAGYAEIGTRLLKDPATLLSNNPYAPWIENYADPVYLSGVQASLALFEKLALERGGESRFNQLAEIFVTATRLEAAFWQMGLDEVARPAVMQ